MQVERFVKVQGLVMFKNLCKFKTVTLWSSQGYSGACIRQHNSFVLHGQNDKYFWHLLITVLLLPIYHTTCDLQFLQPRKLK